MTTDVPRAGTGTPAPAPVQPLDGAQVNGMAAIFGWTPVPRTRTYRLQIAADEAFEALLVDLPVERSTEITLYDLLPVDGRTLYWRVRAEAPPTAWSTPIRFTAGTVNRAAGQERATAAPRGTTAAAGGAIPAASPSAPGALAPGAPPYRSGVTTAREATVALLWMLATVLVLAALIAPAIP